MRRLTLEEVKAAYEKTGLNPVRGITIGVYTNCGCPIGAIYLAEGGSKVVGRLGTGLCGRFLGLDPVYVTGFVCGFDGGETRNGSRHDTFNLAYYDGAFIARHIFSSGVKTDG